MSKNVHDQYVSATLQLGCANYAGPPLIHILKKGFYRKATSAKGVTPNGAWQSTTGVCIKVHALDLTLLWYHGVNMTPGLFDRLNIPNFEIISFHLALYFLCRFLSTVSIHSILILMLPFLYILHFICLRSY